MDLAAAAIATPEQAIWAALVPGPSIARPAIAGSPHLPFHLDAGTGTLMTDVAAPSAGPIAFDGIAFLRWTAATAEVIGLAWVYADVAGVPLKSVGRGGVKDPRGPEPQYGTDLACSPQELAPCHSLHDRNTRP